MMKNILQGDAPLFVQVREELISQISELDQGAKLPSERELSELFEVDRVTIRRAMQDLEQEGCITRHRGKGTFVKKTIRVRGLTTAAKMIGLVIPDVEIPSNARMLKGAEEEASKLGYSLLVCNSLLDTQRERDILLNLSRMDLTGMIVTPFHSDSLDPDYARLLNEISDSGKSVVLIDQYLPGSEIPSVVSDKVQIGYMATEHLILLGHKRICYACTGSFDVSGRDCVRGYKMALADYNIEYDDSLVIDIPITMSANPTQMAVTKMLTENPRAFTAIATPYASMLRGIMSAMSDLNLKAPEDIAVVGGDTFNNPQFENITHTLQQASKLGREAIRLLFNASDGSLKTHTLVKPRLIVRQSCGAMTMLPEENTD